MSNLPYDVIDNSLKTIAENMGATVPTRRYSNVKDSIAGTLSAMSSAGGGGGGNIMMVHITFVEGQPVSDKTLAEIQQHHASGGIVYCEYIPYGNNTNTTSVSYIDDYEARFTFVDFTSHSGMSGTWNMINVCINSSDSVLVSVKSMAGA